MVKLKNRQTLRYCVMRMQSVSVVAKFKTRQYVLKMDSPKLMLTKFSCYMVHTLLTGHTLRNDRNDFGVVYGPCICDVRHY